MPNRMHFFVTGATGFIGGYVTSQLLARGESVTVLVRTQAQARALAPYGVRPHIGDVTLKESMRRGMRGADGVFHLAAYTHLGDRDRRTIETVNIEGTRNVLELMRELRVPKGVYTSDVVVYGDTRGRVVDEAYRYEGRHVTRYARSKWSAHYDVALPLSRRQVPLVIVVPGITYGPQDTSRMGGVFGRHLVGRAPLVPTRTAYNWAHVEDVAYGHLLAMDLGTSGETYNLTGMPYSLRRAMGFAGRAAGKRMGPLLTPHLLFRVAAGLAATLGVLVPRWRGSAEHLRAVAGITHLADNAKARRELGFDPRAIEDGMPDYVRALLQERFEAPYSL
jgi:nucleoside-diphosphate-sugar epimerase